MEIVRGINSLKKKIKNPVLAIGVFDGIHRGHQKLLAKTVERARKINGTPVVMTFSPHPVHVLRPENYCPLIVSLPFRLKLIARQGIHVCVVVPFTKKFSRLSPYQFIRHYIVGKIDPREIIVGDDFRFGEDRAGSLMIFRQEGQKSRFQLRLVSTHRGGRKTIGSTPIREFISAGQLDRARRLLGRPVSLLGRVVRGDSRGKTLGYPTANINPSGEVLPPSGVYLVHVVWAGKIYDGVANVGRRPSFKKINRVNIEVHIFNFHKNLYGREIIVEFIKKIRDEKLFQSRQELIDQIQEDEKKAKTWFRRHKRS